MTVGEWLAVARASLAAAGVEAHATEARVLAAHALEVDTSWILANCSQAHFGADALTFADGLLRRRLAGEPLAYILGAREFYGRSFLVGPGVLIPRHETETVLELALDSLVPGARVVDVGTGSGCLGITISLECPSARVFGVDRSEQALEYARRNGSILSSSCKFIAANLLDCICPGSVDLVVSNPPYVDAEDALPKEVREWEPAEALFARESGMFFYRRIAQDAQRVLSARGKLVFELGDGLAERVVALLQEIGFDLAELRRDLGGMPRAGLFVPRTCSLS